MAEVAPDEGAPLQEEAPREHHQNAVHQNQVRERRVAVRLCSKENAHQLSHTHTRAHASAKFLGKSALTPQDYSFNPHWGFNPKSISPGHLIYLRLDRSERNSQLSSLLRGHFPGTTAVHFTLCPSYWELHWDHEAENLEQVPKYYSFRPYRFFLCKSTEMRTQFLAFGNWVSPEKQKDAPVWQRDLRSPRRLATRTGHSACGPWNRFRQRFLTFGLTICHQGSSNQQ